MNTQPKPIRARPNWAAVCDAQARLEAAQEVIAEHELSLVAARHEASFWRAKCDEYVCEAGGLRSRLRYFWRWQWVAVPVLLMVGAVVGLAVAK